MSKPKAAWSIRAQEIVTEFPKASTRQLGMMLFEKYPLVYKNAEDARMAVRKRRGASGKHDRPYATSQPSPFSALKNKLPRSYSLRNAKPYRITGSKRTLIFGDTHFPYQCNQAIHAMLSDAVHQDITGILINGDLGDNHWSSDFDKEPNAVKFVSEIETIIKFLEYLRKVFPDLPIWFKFGNHCERHEKFLFRKCEHLFGHSNFKLESILELERLKIKWIKDKRRVLIGKLNVLHGHEYRGGFGRPVNPARWILLRSKTNVLANHFHVQSTDSQRSIDGETKAAWTIGCLCDLNPPYNPYNEWTHGYAIVEVLDSAGHFRVEVKHISKKFKVY
jgi:hypothetical protein